MPSKSYTNKRPIWWSSVNPQLQGYIGTRDETKYFTVIHPCGKVLWETPTMYEQAMNTTLSQSVHDAHKLRTAGL
jgi:hypothetical protein